MMSTLRSAAGLGLALVGTGVHGFVGINFSLDLMTDRLDNRFAVDKLMEHYPSLTHAKIFNKDIAMLTALITGGIRNIGVAIEEYRVRDGECTPEFAEEYVSDLLQLFDVGAESIIINIGNEPFLYRDPEQTINTPTCMRNVINAVKVQGRSSEIKVVCPFSYAIVEKSYPIDTGVFYEDYKDVIKQVAVMQAEQGAPFALNVYPFFSYIENPADISLDFALGNLEGNSLLANMVYAAEYALKDLLDDYTKEKYTILIGELGWPSAGNAVGSIPNAKDFSNNAWKFLTRERYSGYFFEAFDELNKGNGNTAHENWFGHLGQDGTSKYKVDGLAAPNLYEHNTAY